MEQKLKPVWSQNYSTTYEYSKEFHYFTSIEDYKNAFEKFKSENGHYPSSIEVDSTPYLPNSRTIIRKFGGIKKLRELVGLSVEQLDHRKGENRALAMNYSNLKSFNNENDVYLTLVNKFGEEKIHRQAPYTNERLQRCDFKIFTKDKKIFVDIFYPKDKHSLAGCIISKQNKLKKLSIEIKNDFYFVVMNKEMDQNFIDNIVMYKKNKLAENIKVLSYDNFMSII